VLALSVVAGALWLAVTHGATPHAEPHLPWWAVALGFAAAELCVVHVHFRRSAHSFSLADVPFVFGLVFATGDDFVLGALVGHLIVLGLIRRLELVKLLFNLAQLALAAPRKHHPAVDDLVEQHHRLALRILKGGDPAQLCRHRTDDNQSVRTGGLSGARPDPAGSGSRV